MVNCWKRPLAPRCTNTPEERPATQMLPSSSADAPITFPDADDSPSLEKCQPSLFGTMITLPACHGPASGPASVPPSMPPSPASGGPASTPASMPASTPASVGEMMSFDPPLPLPQATATAIAAAAPAAAMYQRMLWPPVDRDGARVAVVCPESDQHAPGGAVARDAQANVGHRRIGERLAERLGLVLHVHVIHGPCGVRDGDVDARNAQRPIHSRPETAVDVEGQRRDLRAGHAVRRVLDAVARRVDADEPVRERADPGRAVAQCHDRGHGVVDALTRHHIVDRVPGRIPLTHLVRPQVPPPRNPARRRGFRFGLSGKEIAAEGYDPEQRRATGSAHPHVVAHGVDAGAVV